MTKTRRGFLGLLGAVAGAAVAGVDALLDEAAEFGVPQILPDWSALPEWVVGMRRRGELSFVINFEPDYLSIGAEYVPDEPTTVHVAEWGGDVTLRSMSPEQAQRFAEMING